MVLISEIRKRTDYIATHPQEHLACLTLDRLHKVIGCHIVFKGTVSSAPFHPREILKAAIDDLASSIVIVHNHPSGSTDPSPDDIERTQQLVAACQLVGIRLDDHVIVSPSGYYSFKGNGQIYPAKDVTEVVR